MSGKTRRKARKRKPKPWPEGDVTVTVMPGAAEQPPGEAAGRTVVVAYESNVAATLLLVGTAVAAAWFAVKVHWAASVVVAGAVALFVTAPRSMRIDASSVTIRRLIGARTIDLEEAEKLQGAFRDLIRVRRVAEQAKIPHPCQAALEWLLATRDGRTHQALEQMALMLDVYEEAGTGPLLLLAVRDGAVEPLSLSDHWCVSESGTLHPRVRRIRKAAAKAAIVAVPRTTDLDVVRAGEELITFFVPLGTQDTTAILLVDEDEGSDRLAAAFVSLGLEPADDGMKVVRGRASKTAA